MGVRCEERNTSREAGKASTARSQRPGMPAKEQTFP